MLHLLIDFGNHVFFFRKLQVAMRMQYQISSNVKPLWFLSPKILSRGDAIKSFSQYEWITQINIPASAINARGGGSESVQEIFL